MPRVGIWLDLDWGLKREFEVYAGCQQFGDEAGWVCTLDPTLEETLEDAPGDSPYDGILGRITPEIAEAARRAGVPCVNVWLNSPVNGVPGVFNDFAAQGAMAGEHLLARGFRQFGFLGHQRLRDSRLRLKGYRERLRRGGYRCASFRFPHSLLSLSQRATAWRTFINGLHAWVDSWEPPLGVFVCDDLICRFLIDVCRSKGLSVPGEVAIVGSGNETLMCESPAPSLTSIDAGHSRKGYQAAALLDDLMNGGVPPSQPILVPPAELVRRRSTDFYASDDPLVARALRFIAERGDRPMTVPDLVKAMAVNRRTLERKFQANVGRSISAEITRLRVERAKRRLVETDIPLKTVAVEAGFRSANHFSRVFARVEGMSPTSFRIERQKVFAKRPQ